MNLKAMEELTFLMMKLLFGLVQQIFYQVMVLMDFKEFRFLAYQMKHKPLLLKESLMTLLGQVLMVRILKE